MRVRKMGEDVTVVITAMTDPEKQWFGFALESVLQQTVSPQKIIVLVCEGNSWVDREIDLFSEKGLDITAVELHPISMALLGAVRNTGVSLTSTKWVAFLDGDDIWMHNKLEQQLIVANREQADFVGTDFVFITAEGKRFGYSNGSTPTPSSWLVRTEIMKQFPFDPYNRIGEDHIWLLETKPHVSRIRIPTVLVKYRIRAGSISAAKANSMLRVIRELAARFSQLTLVRILILSVSYLRYRVYRDRDYDV